MLNAIGITGRFEGVRLQQDVQWIISRAVGYATRRCADFMAQISTVRETGTQSFCMQEPVWDQAKGT